MATQERIYQLPAGAAVTDTSFFPNEDTANLNVTEKLSALQIYTYLLTKLASASLSVVTLNVANTGASSGGIKFNNINFISNYGSLNTFTGLNCGNTTLTTGSATGNTGYGANTLTSLTIGSSNTGIGDSVLDGCTSGTNNTGVGEAVMTNLTTGGGNTGIGDSALSGIVTGNSNIGIGQNAGSNYTGSESSNINIGNNGTAAESHTLRIGTQGSGSGQQSVCYIAGIQGVSVSNKQIVTINTSTQQMGSDSLSNFALVSTVNTFTAAQAGAFVTLTDASTIAIDSSLGNNFNLTLGGNRTLGVPTNMVAGRSGVINVRQDITGSRTLAYSWPYIFAGGVAPILSTGKLVLDELVYNINSYNTSTVTVTIASPAVMTWTAHGLVSGQRIQLTTTGALPTGLSANTTYWVTVIDANTFNLSTSLANAQAATFINTSGSQSGVHTATNASITITANLGLA